MFGWGMPDRETIPSHLQRIVEGAVVTKSVRVTNHGHAWFFSSTELALYVSELRTAAELPDIVVFLDGLNDARLAGTGFNIPYFSSVAAAGWEKEREVRFRLRDTSIGARFHWFRMNEQFPLLRLARRFQQPTAGESPRDSEYEKRFQAAGDQVEAAIRAYRINRNVIQQVGSSMGIRTYQFLQPVRGVGRYENDRHNPEREGAARFYEAVSADLDTPGFHDIHDAILDLNFPYVDHNHYSDEGSLRVATRMAEFILKDPVLDPQS